MHDLLKPILRRRLKQEVELSLEPFVESVIECPLSSLQLDQYKSLLKHGCAALAKGLDVKLAGDAMKRLQML